MSRTLWVVIPSLDSTHPVVVPPMRPAELWHLLIRSFCDGLLINRGRIGGR